MRFRIGDRVACAVEDATTNFTMWAAGTVSEVNYSMEQALKSLLPEEEWKGDACFLPYRVELDNGLTVLVHRDEHWLVRD